MVDSRWMTVEEFGVFQGSFSAKTPINMSTCKATGVKYIAIIAGRFRDLSEEELKRKREEFINALPDGATLSGESEMPLWVQVEFLANLIDFETNPPCGCKSEGGHSG